MDVEARQFSTAPPLCIRSVYWSVVSLHQRADRRGHCGDLPATATYVHINSSAVVCTRTATIDHSLSFVCLCVCLFVCCMIYSSVINADAALSAETAVNWHQTTRSHIRVDCARHTHSYN